MSTRAVRAGLLVASVALASTALAGQGRAPAARPGDCPRDPVAFHPCALARAMTFTPPRTPDGKPDMQGIWRGQSGGVENIEAHAGNGDVNAGPTFVVDPPDGKVPYQPWGFAQRKENFEKYIDPNVSCLSSGVPRMLYTPGDIAIVQSPGTFVITHSRSHTFRVIPTGAQPQVSASVALALGSSRGRWEGNTLVVDVTNQNGRTWLDQAGNFESAAAHVVERFTMIDADTIHYEARIEDPVVYTRPWTMAFAIRRVMDPRYEVYEEACHEGEQDTEHLLGLGLKPYPGITQRPNATGR
ncbi:MAG TPA: hypothetical protein VN654_05840 [Vicinamibacterales bacterium]|jgi:hypothetical protein|nr:hypothetical protein [Vicinamibacterales bacterium]